MNWNTSLFLFVCLLLFRAEPTAYGGSQARDPIGATAVGLHHSHSNADPSPICNLHHSSRQHRIPNLLSEARDQTCNLKVPSQIRFHRHDGNSVSLTDFKSCKPVPWLEHRLHNQVHAGEHLYLVSKIFTTINNVAINNFACIYVHTCTSRLVEGHRISGLPQFEKLYSRPSPFLWPT